MTNRERLYNMNIFDLLARLNKALVKVGRCVMVALDRPDKLEECNQDCPRCIACWLSEEERPVKT